MSYQNLIRVDQLTGQNYDTWKIQMQSLLIKGDHWEYVSGENPKPNAADKIPEWTKMDNKAKAEIILALSPPLLKDVKDCATSQETWRKLQETYDSKIPTRKAALLKKLILNKASDNDIEKHVSNFFDVINKLNSIDIKIDDDLVSILLLYSLPDSFTNFRIAIEARDDLPKPSALKIKIIEEYHSRQSSSSSEALILEQNKREKYKPNYNQGKGKNIRHKLMCYKCKKYGHIAAECRSKGRSYGKTSFIQETTFVISGDDVTTSPWVLDSGATSHMANDLAMFSDFKKIEAKINLANDKTTEIKGKGNICIFLENRNKINLRNVLYIPDLRANLISISKITENNHTITFSGKEAIVKNASNDTILKAVKKNNLYEVKVSNIREEVNYITKEDKINLWHQRYGHVNYKALANMINRKKVQGINIKHVPTNYNFDCVTCIQNKQTVKAFPKQGRKRREKLLELIHCDLCGPINVTSNGGARYFVTFIDDASRWCEVYFLKNKSETLKAFKEYKAKVENFKDAHVKILRSDNGKEFLNNDFSNFLRDSGIQHQLTAEYTPQQNGVAERKNRTLLEMARCMLSQSGLPIYLWAEAIATANYIRNRTESCSIDGKTPYELWKNRNPRVSHLRIFGTLAYALQKGVSKRKFDVKSNPYYLVGYSEQAKAYRLWSKETGKVIKSRDVTFVGEGQTVISKNAQLNENRPDYREILEIKLEESKENNYKGTEEHEELHKEKEKDNINSKGTEGYEEQHREEESGNTNSNTKTKRGRPKLIRTGQRGRPRKIHGTQEDKNEDIETNQNNRKKNDEKEEERNRDTSILNKINNNTDAINIENSNNNSDDEEPFYGFIANENDPKSINEPTESINYKEWENAIKEEFTAHERNKTWSIVEKPGNVKVIGNRWVFTYKYDEKGKLVKRKARLVAKGCAQIPGVDFDETYSPVARQKSIRIIIAIAAKFDLILHQYDITTAYLNGDLKQTTYMKIPKYFEEVYGTGESMEGKVCKLNKAIYGLKQSGRVWYQRLDEYLKKIGCTNLQTEPCLYYYKSKPFFIFIGIYVDDIIVASSNQNGIKWFTNQLSNEFDIKDLGKLKYFLGIEIEHQPNGDIKLHQRKFINKILEKFHMVDCNPVKTPMDPNAKLTKNMCPKTEDERRELTKFPYQNLIGSLLYLAMTTRPDIMYAVNSLSRYNSNFGKSHWIAAKRVLRYLKYTINYALTFRKTNDDLHGFADADWGSDLDDRKSYSGYLFKMSNGPISWETKKQRTVALSTAEAEYMALTEATKEAIHLKNLLLELGIRDNIPINIYNDNRSAQFMANNPSINNRSKHIDMREHFIRNAVTKGEIKLNYMETNSMPADIFTKPLPTSKFESYLPDLSLENHTE